MSTIGAQLNYSERIDFQIQNGEGGVARKHSRYFVRPKLNFLSKNSFKHQNIDLFLFHRVITQEMIRIDIRLRNDKTSIILRVGT